MPVGWHQVCVWDCTRVWFEPWYSLWWCKVWKWSLSVFFFFQSNLSSIVWAASAEDLSPPWCQSVNLLMLCFWRPTAPMCRVFTDIHGVCVRQKCLWSLFSALPFPLLLCVCVCRCVSSWSLCVCVCVSTWVLSVLTSVFVWNKVSSGSSWSTLLLPYCNWCHLFWLC